MRLRARFLVSNGDVKRRKIGSTREKAKKYPLIRGYICGSKSERKIAVFAMEIVVGVVTNESKEKKGSKSKQQ